MISVIGCGYWGKNIIKTLSKNGSLYSVHDLNEDIQKKFSNNYSLKNISLEKMLADKNVNGVMIATNANTHYEVAMQCLENGKDIFIEKPICLSLSEAENLGLFSKRKGLILMVGHLLQYHDHFLTLKDLISKGSYGPIKRIRSSRKSFGIIREHEDVIWSFAPHDISMILSLCTDKCPSNLKLIRSKYFNRNTDRAFINFSLGDIDVELDLDWASSEKEQKIEVYCENGVIIFEDSNLNLKEKLYVIDEIFSKENLTTKSQSKKMYINVESNGTPLENECRCFHESIKTRLNPYTDYIEASRVLELLLNLEKIG